MIAAYALGVFFLGVLVVVGCQWGCFVAYRRKMREQLQAERQASAELNKHFMDVAHEWVRMARRVSPRPANVECVARMLAEVEARSEMQRCMERDP